ncbi:nuclear transport factor 2 family protein [Clostridium sp. UBA6640]|uniref:nuclear transport factor 2 family protein n=1 Tax=Clostridium sp. UBA6640 TaxID=1946370 RepID=UPI0025C2C825|nr:nuclear transport factor 2 family protein [Clostridium sp. UBA6640]
MNKFGIQYLDDKSLRKFSGKKHIFHDSTEDHRDIRELLRQFQIGYTERDVEKAETFMEELFIIGEETCALGTSTEELFLGSEEVKTLIRDDWEYWGDFNMDWERAHISVKDEVAWFATTASVKHTFEDTPERYDSYVNFIKNKAEETGLTSKEKIAFINWVLALTYHQRLDEKREYLWPVCLSGVLLKQENKWKFTHLQFSIPKANFPDQRFESSKEYVESYNKHNAMACKYKNNQVNMEIKSLLKSIETELVGQENISKELISKYFAIDNISYVMGPDNQWYYGVDQIKEFFEKSRASSLSMDLEYAIATKSGEMAWVTVSGTLKQELTEDELAEGALVELDNLFKSNLSSKEKLFVAHRSVSCALKEGAIGTNYTCPIRLTALVSNCGDKPVFNYIHFSFPFYWIFEGKIDSI